MSSKKLRYPVVLVPGLFGHTKLMGSHFFGIQKAMQKTGNQVTVAHIPAVNHNEVLGQYLIKYITQLQQTNNNKKIHLIGYSQGALASRYAAAVCPELIASVTSVSGPNHGSEIADLAIQALSNKLVLPIAKMAQKHINNLLLLVVDHQYAPINLEKAVESMTTKQIIEEFNKKYPQGLPSIWGDEGKELESNGVYYYSWGGCLTNNLLGEGANILDPTHYILCQLSRLFKKERQQNDGVVGRFSSHLGKVISSNYPMDHLDAANQIRGLVSSRVDPVALYLNHLELLHQKGL